jgi:hypothetical protein
MARRKPREYNDDDGRVICNMEPVSNLDLKGRVWSHPFGQREEREEKKPQIPTGERMTRSEARRFTWNAMLAGLVVALVFSAVWVLFTLFATQVWFR